MQRSEAAVTAALKAVEAGRAKRLAAVAKTMEEWLTAYRAGLSDPATEVAR